MRVEAPPHDLLKLCYWKDHAKLKYLPDFLRGTELAWAVKNHEKTNHPLHKADIISSAVARIRMLHTYWGEIGLEDVHPFMLRVYGGPEFWDEKRQRRTLDEIFQVFKRYGVNPDAYARANDMLSSFPQDSRFPLVSLKTHHWLSWALYKQINASLKDIPIEELTLFIIKISANYSDSDRLHRLKEMREFFAFKADVGKAIRSILKQNQEYEPLIAGDDVILPVLARIRENEGESISKSPQISRILQCVMSLELPLKVQIYEHKLERRDIEVRKGEKRKYTIVREPPRLIEYGFGFEKLEYLAGSAEWEPHLNKPHVAWISIRPAGDLLFSAYEFSKRAEKILARFKRIEVPEPIYTDAVSPDLLLSVFEGYVDFLNDISGKLSEYARKKKLPKPDIIRSFDHSLFVIGLDDTDEGAHIYSDILKMKDKLLIPLNISVIVTRSKHPFWHVIELSEKFKNNLVFVEKMVEVPEEIIRILEKSANEMRAITRSMFNKEILAKIKLTTKEELKFHLKGLVADGKIRNKQLCETLSHLLDEIAARCGGDEIKRRQLTYKAFKYLEPFTKGESREGRKGIGRR